MVFVGVDPGKMGAVAEIKPDCYMDVIDMPLSANKEISVPDLVKFFEQIVFKANAESEEIFCVIEKSQAMPKQGVKGVFTYGVGYGTIRTLLYVYEIPFQEIHPMTWKKEFNLIKKDKSESVAVAQKMFPKQAFYTERGRMLDGRAEAILLAEYARRIHK